MRKQIRILTVLRKLWSYVLEFRKSTVFLLSLPTSSFFDRSQDKRNEKMGLYTSIVVNFQYISIFAVVASAFLMILYTLRIFETSKERFIM